MEEHPRLLHTVIDTTAPRLVAEFYRVLMGLRYRPGDEVPAPGIPDDADWLVLRDEHGSNVLAFQEVDRLEPTTWPEAGVPMQLHLDLTVGDATALERQRQRAQELGARLVLDRSEDPEEPLYVLADPAGHPFCIFVA